MNSPSLIEKLLALLLLFCSAGLMWLSVGQTYVDYLLSLNRNAELMLDEAALLSARAARSEQDSVVGSAEANHLVMTGVSGSGILQLQNVLSQESSGKEVTIISLEPLAFDEVTRKVRLRVRMTASSKGLEDLFHGLESRGTGDNSGPMISLEEVTIRKGMIGSGRDTRELDCEFTITAREV